MKPLRLPPARLGLADIAILCLLGGVIAVVVSFAREFEAPFSQAVRIDLSPAALPWYTLYSLSRGVLALLISYLFALGFGWAAAKSPAAERLLLPLLDILQSIPVLGFLPGLVLGLMSLFPTRNVGLELAAILMIFTAQAWNLALSFYNSLKALPQPLRDACKVAGWPPGRTFRQLEVPAAAQGLVWNGMLSMAGGWFFLMVNEAFRLGDHDYRLPGIGSYMSVALDQGNVRAMALAIGAMVAMIVCVDQLLWRPLVVWVEKFRLDETPGGGPRPSSWVLEFLRHAHLPRHAARYQQRAYRSARRATRTLELPFRAVGPVLVRAPRLALEHPLARKIGTALLVMVLAAGAAWGAWHLWLLLGQVKWTDRGRLLPAAALVGLARAVPPGGAPRSHHRLGHGRGRRVERLDRGRIHRGRWQIANHQGTGELDQRGDGARQLPVAGGGDRAHEPRRGELESPGVALDDGLGPGSLRVGAVTPPQGTVLLE